MYLTVTYVNSEKKRYITIPEGLSVVELNMIVSTLSVCPGVDKVWINIKEPGTNEKTDNNTRQS